MQCAVKGKYCLVTIWGIANSCYDTFICAANIFLSIKLSRENSAGNEVVISETEPKFYISIVKYGLGVHKQGNI